MSVVCFGCSFHFKILWMVSRCWLVLRGPSLIYRKVLERYSCGSVTFYSVKITVEFPVLADYPQGPLGRILMLGCTECFSTMFFIVCHNLLYNEFMYADLSCVYVLLKPWDVRLLDLCGHKWNWLKVLYINTNKQLKVSTCYAYPLYFLRDCFPFPTLHSLSLCKLT